MSNDAMSPIDAYLLERVAQALHEYNRGWCPPHWEQLAEGARHDYRKEARAALRAVAIGLLRCADAQRSPEVGRRESPVPHDDDRVIMCHVIEDERDQDECTTGDMS